MNATITAFENVNETDPIHSPAIQSGFCVVYTIIFVLGMFGNLLTCYVVCRNRDMQTVTNFFIANLALSDILLCTLSIPFTPLYSFHGKWIFGGAMCHIVSSVQGTSVYVSTLTLTSIAVDRFFVIIYPFRRRMKVKTCIFIICATWLLSIFAIAPYGYFMEYQELETENICEEKWPSATFRKAYGVLTITCQFILPFIIIAVCYVKISMKLSEQTRSRPGVSNPRREEVERGRKQRTNRMLIAMVLIFGLCWLPFNFVNILNDFSDSPNGWIYYNLCFFIMHVVAMSSTCYNPFLYAWLNENFRKEFKHVLPGLHRSAKPAQRACNGNDTVQDSLLTSMSVVRRSSSVRERKNDRPIDVGKVKYSAEEEKVNLSLRTDDLTVNLVDSNRSSSPTGTKSELLSKAAIGSEQGHLV